MSLYVLAVLESIMHEISSGLLAPTIAVLLFLVAFVVFETGSLLVEYFSQRRKAQVNIPDLLDSFKGQKAEDIAVKIEASGLFRRQKSALGQLIQHRDLNALSHQALARKLLANEELYYTRITNRTDLVARLGPMLGLMATLIPLGPGLIAMGQGDTKTRADALITAFDATVTGLATATVAYAISRLRKRWYEEYLSSMETLLESLLEVLPGETRIAK